MANPKNIFPKDPEEIPKSEANPAPMNDPIVFPRLFIDINSAKSVPSIPGGHRRPDKIKNGMNLRYKQKHVYELTRNYVLEIIRRKRTYLS